MDSSVPFMIFLQLILIALNAVFACAEIAVISVNDSRLARLAAEGDKRAVRLARLTSQPAKFLATIQVAITLSGFLGSAFAADNFSDGLVSWLIGLGVRIPEKALDTIAVIFITIVLSYFTLVLGELVPKRIAMRKAEKLALGMSGIITAISKLFAPIVWLLTRSTNLILRLFRIDPNAKDDELSEEDIRMMVDAGSESGAIDREEKEFIQNVFEFDDLSAGEIATHRTEISILWLEESMEEWAKTIHNARHTLYPVCDDSIDNIVGILNAKDYYRLSDRDRTSVLENAVTRPYFVPESVKADVLFRNMKKSRNNLAVVLDEYGGMTGIVTINDLLQQLVGDFGDDEPVEKAEAHIESIDPDTWRIPGSVSLDEVSEAVGIPLPCEEYETFGGFVFDTLGSIPEDGMSVTVETAALRIRVTEIKDHRIKSAVVSLSRPADKQEAVINEATEDNIRTDDG